MLYTVGNLINCNIYSPQMWNLIKELSKPTIIKSIIRKGKKCASHLKSNFLLIVLYSDWDEM